MFGNIVLFLFNLQESSIEIQFCGNFCRGQLQDKIVKKEIKFRVLTCAF